MAQQYPAPGKLETNLTRKAAQPFPVFFRCVLTGVPVAQPGKVVVARVSVAALAIGQIPCEGIVVITGKGFYPVLFQQRIDLVGAGAKGPEVPETVDRGDGPG